MRSALLAAALVVLAAAPAAAQPLHPAQTLLDVNEMTAWLRNDALFPPTVIAARPGGYDWLANGTFPKDAPLSPVYARGLLWGGQVRDGLDTLVRVGGSAYASGLAPGRVLRDAAGRVTRADVPDPEKYHVWRVHRYWPTVNFSTAAARFFGKSLMDVRPAEWQAMRDQYAYDWNHWPADWGAPFDDVDGDGRYDPAVDVPGVPGAQQTLWIVTNDLDSAAVAYGSPAIGLEYQLTLWASDYPYGHRLEDLDTVHFMRARLIYTGRPETPPGARIDSMFVALFNDPDIGDPTDDFGACDTSRALAYAYSAVEHEPYYTVFGLAPPAIGWDFLRTPRGDDGEPVGLSLCYVKRTGSSLGDPDSGVYAGSLQWYNLMRGRRPRPAYPAGAPLRDLHGNPTRHTVTGDPLGPSGWVDGVDLPPGERRLWLAAGPFSMALGDTVDVVVAQIGALGTSRLSSVSLLLQSDRMAQWVADQAAATPVAPAAEVPRDLALQPAYPNPFNPVTTLSLSVDRPQRVRVAVYDVLGRRVALLHDGPLAAGVHRLTFDARRLPSGTYLVRAAGETGTSARRVVLAK